MPCRLNTKTAWLVSLLWFLLPGDLLHWTTMCCAAPPFVAGFDRFGRHDEIDAVVAGELLLSELSCTACHQTAEARLQPKLGPLLQGVGNRLHANWIRNYLADPQSTKPGTTMPAALHAVPEAEQAAAIEALVAFLETLQQPFPEIVASGLKPVPFEFWDRGNSNRGRELYHQIGCVACHAADETYEVVAVKPSALDELLEQLEPEELAELGLSGAARQVQPVPHAKLGEKYTAQSLTFFLLNPESVRPAGRMPSFQLAETDAADIAAYLLQQIVEPESRSTPPAAALVARGKTLFTELRCSACHAVPGVAVAPVAKELKQLDLSAARRCDQQPRNGQPAYELDDVQHAAINVAITQLSLSPKNNNSENNNSGDPQVQANRELLHTMLQLNCLACHERGQLHEQHHEQQHEPGQLGGVGRYQKPYFETVGHVDIGDEGRLPPPLTGVGHKLTSAWLKTVLAGKGGVRPYMTIRMPQFPAAQVKGLPELLINADAGTHQPGIDAVFAAGEQPALAAVGRQLMDTGCVQCHAFKGETLPGTVGLDLAGVTARIHPRWFHDFLVNPATLKARTRMPTFFPDGRSANQELLHGEMEPQIAAMWAYLQALEEQPLPEKIAAARAQNYELIPLDRPLLLRTFMPHAGTHAIAVGFPERVHFAFDAEQVGVALGWKGRFLDAEGTWFVRFAPPANPLGEAVVQFPSGPGLALLETESTPWPSDAATAQCRFRGYRLDAQGAPTFLYEVASHHVTDRIQVDEQGQLVRQLTIKHPATPASGALWFRGLTGVTGPRDETGWLTNDVGLKARLLSREAGLVRQREQQSEWLVPLPRSEQEVQIEVQYAW